MDPSVGIRTSQHINQILKQLYLQPYRTFCEGCSSISHLNSTFQQQFKFQSHIKMVAIEAVQPFDFIIVGGEFRLL
jgi:hypothetical protein